MMSRCYSPYHLYIRGLLEACGCEMRRKPTRVMLPDTSTMLSDLGRCIQQQFFASAIADVSQLSALVLSLTAL